MYVWCTTCWLPIVCTRAHINMLCDVPHKSVLVMKAPPFGLGRVAGRCGVCYI